MQYGAPHTAQNDYSSNSLQTYKYGHSLSLNSHNERVEDVLRPRSSWVSAKRATVMRDSFLRAKYPL